MRRSTAAQGSSARHAVRGWGPGVPGERVHEEPGAAGPKRGPTRRTNLFHPNAAGSLSSSNSSKRRTERRLPERRRRAGRRARSVSRRPGSSPSSPGSPPAWRVTPNPRGTGPAALGLPGPGLPLHERGDPRRAGAKRSADEAVDMVPDHGDAVEARPPERSAKHGVGERHSRAELAVPGSRRESAHPVDDRGRRGPRRPGRAPVPRAARPARGGEGGSSRRCRERSDARSLARCWGLPSRR